MMSDWLLKKISWFAGCLAIAFLFGLVAFAANIEIKDMDLWLHLASGKHILQTLSIPQVDIFSSTLANAPWINHEWLFQIIVYFCYSMAGFDGLISLKVWVVFLTFALLLFLGYTREQKVGPIVVLLLVLLVYQIRLTLRPDIFSLLFFVAYILILGVYLDRRWAPVVLGLLQILWTNMHGFFIFGPVLVLTALVSEGLKRHTRLPYEWNKIGRLSVEEYNRLKVVLGAVVLACLVNPSFIKGAVYPFGVLFSLGGESRVFFEQIQELQRPFHWGNLFALEPYLYLRLLIIISFLSFWLNRRKIDINALLLWFIFLVFSLCALRNVVYFAFAAYLAFLTNTQNVSASNYFSEKYNSVRLRSVCSIIIKIALLVWMMHYGERLMRNGYYDFDRFERKSEYGGVSLRNFPHKAADFLVEKNIRGNFFNDFNSGAYLLGRTYPHIKVSMDGRTEVYGAEYYKKHRDAWKGNTELFDEIADTHQLTGAFLSYVYVPAPSKIIRYLYDHQDWVLVYFDFDAAVFLKNVPANRIWIDRNRMDLRQWQVPDAQLLKIGTHKVSPYRFINRAYALYNMGLTEKSQQEAEEALRIEPYNVQAHKLLGKIYNERSEYATAFAHLRQAKLLDPDDMNIRYQIALALFHLGETQQAREQCQRVLDRYPEDQEAIALMTEIRQTIKR